jgi:DNA-binding transcriptional LysR family regulator
MNLRELEVFNALMKTGTTVGAAQALFMSQPAVSKTLKHLESRMGFRLFERVRGRLQPTPEGQTLFRQVRSVFSRLETVDRIAQDIKQGRNGTVSVATTPTIANTLLADAVARFRTLQPDIRVIFRSIRSSDVVRRVAEGEADFGIVHLPSDHAGLDAVELMPAEIVCMARADHPLAAIDEVDLADLARHPLISYRPGTGIGAMIGATFRGRGIEKSIDVQTSLSATACAIAARGAAVALHDPFSIAFGSYPNLVVRRVRPAMRMSVTLLFSPEYPNSIVASRLLAELRAVAADARRRLDECLAVPGTGRARA